MYLEKVDFTQFSDEEYQDILNNVDKEVWIILEQISIETQIPLMLLVTETAADAFILTRTIVNIVVMKKKYNLKTVADLIGKYLWSLVKT